MGMLGGNVELVAVSTVFTNLAAAGLFPLILISLNGEFHGEIFWDSARSVGLTVILPAVLASLYRKYGRNAEAAGKKLAPCSFYLWIVTLFLVSAKAGVFLREQSSARAFLLSTASAAGILCALHFWLGSRIGKYFNCPREGSQALGQKNTSLTIYLAMTYSSPAAAMGPAFYIFFHNFWNACQLHRYEKTKRKEKRIHESGGF